MYSSEISEYDDKTHVHLRYIYIYRKFICRDTDNLLIIIFQAGMFLCINETFAALMQEEILLKLIN